MFNLSWEIAFPIAVLVLALVVAWALIRNRMRNKANDAITERATKLEYDEPKQAYQNRDRPELKQKLRPN
ncbi:MAG TPA: hypothetical protein VHZ26_17365 [Caulobacteraceae bacterium]|jgi:hypothetical protein|nr:hypothetical protein [Caulobacteraceae bacterium]